MAPAKIETRDDYGYFLSLQTRWMDNDLYGHVNNVTYCNYTRSVAYPDLIDCGLRVGHMGNSSVRYEVGIFRNSEAEACAAGHFIHVFVERESNKPVPIPASIRDAFTGILVEQSS